MLEGYDYCELDDLQEYFLWCSSKYGMTGFHMQSVPGYGTHTFYAYRFKFWCLRGTEAAALVLQTEVLCYTVWEGLRALTGRNISCPGASVLRSWRYYRVNPVRSDCGYIRYECADVVGVNSSAQLRCTSQATWWADPGEHAQLKSLQAHNVSCPPASMLQGWWVETKGPSQLRIAYTCCQIGGWVLRRGGM